MSKDKIQLSDLPPAKRRELLGQEPTKRHKYGVAAKEDRTLDGIVFDSKKEMNRYAELKAMQQAGEIERLELQPKWELHVKGIKVASYVADFKYYDTSKRVWIHEDCKGVRTPVYKLKKKMLHAEYGIEIVET